MNDKILFNNFYKRWEEVTTLPPQTVGPLTPVYKRVIPLFKYAPWRIIVPVTFIAVTAGAFLLQELSAVQLASLLQGGF